MSSTFFLAFGFPIAILETIHSRFHEQDNIFLVGNFHKFHLNIEGNPLDYSNKNIETIYQRFKIEYEYDSLFEFNYK